MALGCEGGPEGPGAPLEWGEIPTSACAGADSPPEDGPRLATGAAAGGFIEIVLSGCPGVKRISSTNNVAVHGGGNFL